MKRYITSILSLILVVWASGCTDNFKEYNTDLSGITEEQKIGRAHV
jgi:uncharacterized lipoprotein YehR (DUF1307 family)